MITRSVLFSLKCTRNRLAAGFRPDPLGELERSPDLLAVLKGGVGAPRRGGKGRDRKDRGEGNEGKDS